MYKEAVESLVKACEIRKVVLGEKNPFFVKTMSKLAEMLLNSERGEEGLRKLISCLSKQTEIGLIQGAKNEILPLAIEKLGGDDSLVVKFRNL